MKANTLRESSGAPETDRPVQDEWGLFDPEQAGIPALIRALDDKGHANRSTSAPPIQASQAVPNAGRATHCPYCTEPLQPGSSKCQLCLRDVNDNGSAEKVTAAPAAAALRQTAQGGAIYTLECASRCPQCHEQIRTIRVLRILRTQVSFTSTLPRKGFVILCPECHGFLSAGLSGLV